MRRFDRKKAAKKANLLLEHRRLVEQASPQEVLSNVLRKMAAGEGWDDQEALYDNAESEVWFDTGIPGVIIYTRFEWEIAKYGSEDPGDYWTPPSYESAEFDVNLVEARLEDEDGEPILTGEDGQALNIAGGLGELKKEFETYAENAHEEYAAEELDNDEGPDPDMYRDDMYEEEEVSEEYYDSRKEVEKYVDAEEIAGKHLWFHTNRTHRNNGWNGMIGIYAADAKGRKTGSPLAYTNEVRLVGNIFFQTSESGSRAIKKTGHRTLIAGVSGVVGETRPGDVSGMHAVTFDPFDAGVFHVINDSDKKEIISADEVYFHASEDGQWSFFVKGPKFAEVPAQPEAELAEGGENFDAQGIADEFAQMANLVATRIKSDDISPDDLFQYIINNREEVVQFVAGLLAKAPENPALIALMMNPREAARLLYV